MKIFKINIDQNRIYGLDILRALAIIFVLIQHSTCYLQNYQILNYISNLAVFDGVLIFFVLSGYLIGRILIKIFERNDFHFINLINFLKQRWLRTLPNYFFVLLLLLFVLPFAFYNYIPNLNDKINYIFFVQNFKTGQIFFFPESWSLCVEEWFYILIPALIIIFVRVLRIRIQYAIFIIALFVIIGVTVYRYYLFTAFSFSNFETWDGIIRRQIITRFDSLMFGLLGALFSIYYIKLWTKYKYLFLLTGIIILFSNKYLASIISTKYGLYDSVFLFGLNSIGTLMLLPYLSELKSGKGLIYKIITLISIISYSLYLINFSVVQDYFVAFVTRNITRIDLIKYFCFWVFTFVFSIIIFKYIEQPFMKLRKK